MIKEKLECLSAEVKDKSCEPVTHEQSPLISDFCSQLFEFFRFKNCILNFLNLLKYFTTSICNGILQVVISTGVLNFSYWQKPVFVIKKPIFQKN